MTKILFVMETGLGHATFYQNLRAAAARCPDVRARWIPITFDAPGLLGRIPRLRHDIVLRAGLQAWAEVRRAYREDPPDVLFLHTQMVSVFCHGFMARTPAVVSLDATPKQFLALGPQYGFSTNPDTPLERRRDRWCRRAFGASARLFTWSQWAADSLAADYGVPQTKVRVFSPGVDLAQWSPGPAPAPGGPLRLLFVGGDLTRKGGDLLLRWMREDAPDGCTLDLVTNVPAPPAPRVTMHAGLGPNDPALRALYTQADLFALPTRADTTALVLMEAMASGLPLLTTDVAALPEVLGARAGVSPVGVLVPPGDYGALAAALACLMADRPALRAMGLAGRARAEAAFDGPANMGREMAALRSLAALP